MELDTFHHVFCSEVWELPKNQKLVHWIFGRFSLASHLDTFQHWATEAGQDYPYNSKLASKFQNLEYSQTERTGRLSSFYNLNARRKVESRDKLDMVQDEKLEQSA